jgi:hypothetical protein
VCTILRGISADGNQFTADGNQFIYGFFDLGACLDMGPEMNLALANTCLGSLFCVYIPFCFLQCNSKEFLHNLLHNGKDRVDCPMCKENHHAFLVLHGTEDKPCNCFAKVFDKKMEELNSYFSTVCAMTFARGTVMDQSYSLLNKRYTECGPFEYLLGSYSKALADEKSSYSPADIIPKHLSAKSTLRDFLQTRQVQTQEQCLFDLELTDIIHHRDLITDECSIGQGGFACRLSG